MTKYAQKVGNCPECGGQTMYDVRDEIVCQVCGLVLHTPGSTQSVSICIENHPPIICREGSGNIPKDTHIVSVVERVGMTMINLKYNL